LDTVKLARRFIAAYRRKLVFKRSVTRASPMSMNNPSHSGLSMRHDCMEPLGLTTTAAAKILGVTRQTLNNLINGKSGISADMAIRLDKAFGDGAETWLPLQMAYDLARPASTRAKSSLNQRSDGEAAVSAEVVCQQKLYSVVSWPLGVILKTVPVPAGPSPIPDVGSCRFIRHQVQIDNRRGDEEPRFC
jgi:addiction module HigA family antidote